MTHRAVRRLARGTGRGWIAQVSMSTGNSSLKNYRVRSVPQHFRIVIRFDDEDIHRCEGGTHRIGHNAKVVDDCCPRSTGASGRYDGNRIVGVVRCGYSLEMERADAYGSGRGKLFGGTVGE